MILLVLATLPFVFGLVIQPLLAVLDPFLALMGFGLVWGATCGLVVRLIGNRVLK